MNSDPDHELQGFVERFFASQGAVVEKHASGLEVLAAPDLAQRIGIPEHCRLSLADDQGAETVRVNYGTALLENITRTAGQQIPLGIANVRFHYLKSQGFDRLLKDAFTFRGAMVQVDHTAEVHTEYLLLNCHFVAQSDEQKEGLIPLAFNLESGAPVGQLEAMLDSVEKVFEPGGTCTPLEARKIDAIIEWVHRQAPQIVETQIQPFRESMNRRFSRDVGNLEAYYAELKQEMTDQLSRSGLSAQLIQERTEKIALIPEELAKKKDDLFKKYSIRVNLELSGAMLIRTPAIKLFCKAIIGRRKKAFTLLYNPIDKSLDPLACDGCGQGATSLHICDRLHLLCPQCTGGCPACASGRS